MKKKKAFTLTITGVADFYEEGDGEITFQEFYDLYRRAIEDALNGKNSLGAKTFTVNSYLSNFRLDKGIGQENES